MPRVLLLSATTGYQVRAFGDAAASLNVSLAFATDRCDQLDDPWHDEAIPIRFHDPDTSTAAILAAVRTHPIDGVLAVGDRPTVIAARVAQALGLPGHPPEAAEAARRKPQTRERLRAAGLPVPWFREVSIHADAQALATTISYPAVLKPAALSGSRGVIRVNDGHELRAAFERVKKLLLAPEVRAERDAAHDTLLVEGFIEGREFAVEGVLHHGHLRTLAIFDKPDPLNGPFFEESIYVTPTSFSVPVQEAMLDSVKRAAAALGLHHGPVHAECRVDASGGVVRSVHVLEVAARPIGGLCARTLRFQPRHGDGGAISLEELLIRQALGADPVGWTREPGAAGVMMIPIPRRGVLRGVSGSDLACLVPHVDEVRITAKLDHPLIPLPEGATYLGFIFARAPRAPDVEQALRSAHERLEFAIDPEVPVLQSRHG